MPWALASAASAHERPRCCAGCRPHLPAPEERGRPSQSPGCGETVPPSQTPRACRTDRALFAPRPSERAGVQTMCWGPGLVCSPWGENMHAWESPIPCGTWQCNPCRQPTKLPLFVLRWGGFSHLFKGRLSLRPGPSVQEGRGASPRCHSTSSWVGTQALGDCPHGVSSWGMDVGYAVLV